MRKKMGNWESFDDIDGLGHECECLLEDRDGNIWIGTSNGLSRYDGKEFINFTNRDGLAANNVHCVYQDNNGNIWTGTGDGLSRYDGKEFVNFTSKDGLAANNIHCIYQDNTGNIWIGTTDGLSRYDGKEFVNFTSKDGLAGNYIHCVYQDNKDKIWIGTLGRGVSCYDGSQFVSFNTEHGLAHNIVLDITQDKSGDIWIGTSDGLSRYNGEGFVNFTSHALEKPESVPRKDGLPGNYVWCLYRDRGGNVWIGTLGGGVSCYDGSQFVNFNTEHGLAHNAVLDIIQDREGSFWFACYHGGISRYNPHDASSLCDEPVDEVMMQDKDGNLWWGFRSILSRYDGKDLKHYHFEHTIFELLEDSRGQFWVGTDGEGVYRYNSVEDVYDAYSEKHQKPQNLTTDDGLVNNRVVRIYEDTQGYIWIGTRGGLSRYDGLKFTNFTDDDGLGHNLVSVIFQDNSGSLWFAGWGSGGIAKYDGKCFYRYTKDNGLIDDRVISIIEDDKNNLWIGTPAGISVYGGGGFRNYTTKDGLSGSFVQRMLQDSRGQIWIATLGGGIGRFDGRNFQALTTEDGLPSNCVTGVIENSDGSMIISTYRGVSRYVPDYKTPPLIHIDEVDADRIYKRPEEIRISESVSSIRIRFHGLSFKTKRMRYSYILEGYDGDWKATWDEDVRYENLPKGEYIFKVIAINKDLVRSEGSAELKVKIVEDPRDMVISELEEKVRERTKELKEAKDYIDNVVRSMADTLIVINQDGIIGTVNQATLDLLGYKEDELVGNPIEMILTKEEKLSKDSDFNDLVEKDFVLDMEKGVIRNIENIYLSKDGREIPVLFSGSLMYDDNGNILGIVCVAQDVTEHKQADGELRKYREHLEELVQERTEELTKTMRQLMQADKMATLGILVSGVAHEINNPNNFILLNAKIFSKAWNDVLPILEEYFEEQGDFALAGMPYTQAHERISQLILGMSEGAQRIQKIVQGLKDFARQDAGELSQSVNINSVIEAAILIVNNLINKSTCRFSCDYGEALPEIQGNAQQLEQVIINLITNACQALPNREKGISISTSYNSDSDKIIIRVCDEGIGIPPENLKHIMDPFFTTKRGSGGTGLGLSISYNIVKAHGGDLSFISEPGKGTTVVLTLPAISEGL